MADTNKHELPPKVEVFLLWLENQKNMADATIAAYSKDLSGFDIFLNQELNKSLQDIASITKKDIKLYLAHMHAKEYSKTSLARKLSTLRTFFNYALRKKEISLSPMLAIHNPKQPKYFPTVPSKEQVVNILEAPQPKAPSTTAKGAKKSANDPQRLAIYARDIALVELLYGSGLRISEALALNVADFLDSKKSLRISGKGGKQRYVPLTELSITSLQEWLNLASSLPNSTMHSSVKPLFIGIRGARLNRREALRIIEKLNTEPDTPHLTAHSFRHAYATHLLEAGLDLRTVQELLGHARIATTQVYTHLNMEHLRNVYKNAHPLENEE